MAKRSNPAMKMAQKTAHNAVFDAEGNPKPGVHNVLLRAVEIQRPLVLANIRRLQRRQPAGHGRAARRDPGTRLSARRDRRRCAGGGTAVIPGVGTVAALGLSAAATVASWRPPRSSPPRWPNFTGCG